MQELSGLFRQFCSNLSSFALNTLEKTIQVAFNIKNLRNVQLWTRAGAVQRNFVNASTSPLELSMRIEFAQGLLEQRQPNVPTKIKEFDGFTEAAGKKLREYLQNDYVRQNTRRILINPDGTLAIEYDTYGDSVGEDELDEDDLDEFR